LVSNYLTGPTGDATMMINALNPPTPPPLPTAEVLSQVMGLIALARDPDSIEARINEYVSQTQAIHAAIAELAAARKAAEDAQAALADLDARERAVADQKAAVEQATTQASVASAALQSRSAELDKRAGELEKLSSELAAREQSLAARVQSYRRGLEA
jgi:ABC-type transporter Mla subunit MlaD